MLRRGLSVAVLVGVLVLIAVPNTGARPVPARVVVVVVDPPQLHDWARSEFRPLVEQGASALLSIRAIESSRHPELDLDAELRTLGAGARQSPSGDGTALGSTLASQGVPFVVDDTFRASLAPKGASAPGDALQSPSVAVYSVAGLPNAVAAKKLGDIAAAMQKRDMLIVLSLTRSYSDVVVHAFLDAITIVGPQVPKGTLYSPTTHRDGVVSLTDLAPTILDTLGIDVPSTMSGRPIEFRPARDPLGTLLPLETDLRRAARARSMEVRIFMTAAMVLIGLFGIVLAFGKSPRWLAWALPPLTAVPLGMLAFSLLPGTKQAIEAGEVAGVALLVGIVASLLMKAPSRAIALIGGVTAVVVLADVLLGSPLAARSPLSFLIAGGSRFYGIGNEYMGVVIGGALVAVAATFAVRDRNTLIARALLLAGAVAVMAAPEAGAKFGATLTAVPAFGVIAARAGGRRLNLKTGAAIGAFSVLSAGAVFLADRLRAPGARSHIGAIGSASDKGVLSRKLSAAKALLTFSIWMKVLLVFAVVLLVLWWRRRDDMRLAVFARPGLGAALQAGAAGMVCAVLFNDAGAIAAAFIGIPMVATLLCAMVEPPIPEVLPEAELRAARAM